jgi:hypothetical protein
MATFHSYFKSPEGKPYQILPFESVWCKIIFFDLREVGNSNGFQTTQFFFPRFFFIVPRKHGPTIPQFAGFNPSAIVIIVPISNNINAVGPIHNIIKGG